MVISDTSGQVENWYNSLKPQFINIGLKIGYCREELNDIINQFFLDILEKNIDFRAVNNPKAYLSTAFRRKLIDHYRNTAKNRFIDLERFPEEHAEPSIQEILEQLHSNTELISRIRSAYKRLPHRCRKVIYLKFYEGLTTEQIADKTGLGKRTVYNNLFEGIKILRIELSQKQTGVQFAALLSLLPLIISAIGFSN
jgi:RNA polymerase sigma-70 factor (ECF subfamily)